MDIKLSVADGVPIYRQIVEQVKRLVVARRLKPGEKLPPVRRLAEALIINPNTVARAYRELEQAGVLTARQGDGVYVATDAEHSPPRMRKQLLFPRIDALLVDARQLGVELPQLFELLTERNQAMDRSDGGGDKGDEQ